MDSNNKTIDGGKLLKEPIDVELTGASWALETSLKTLMDARYDKQQRIKSLKLKDFDMDATMIASVVHVLKVNSDCLEEFHLLQCLGHGIDMLVLTALTTVSSLQTFKVSIGRLATTAFSSIGVALGVGLQVTSSLADLSVLAGANVFFTLSTHAAYSIEQGLAQNKTLKRIHIQSCRFGDPDAVRAIARGLSRQRCLESVKIVQCFVANGRALDDGALSEIIHGLESNLHLNHLDLSGNKCLQEGIVALASLLDHTKLETLNLSCQEQSPETDTELGEVMNISMLVAALGRTATLRNLELRYNKLTDREMAYLSAALSHNTSIDYLGLDNNLITNTGISILASRIPTMKILKKLVLTNNLFDEDGMFELSKSLKENLVLESAVCNNAAGNNNPNQETFQRAQKMIDFYTDCNWGGRRFLDSQNYHRPLSLAIWPLVLERINTRFTDTSNDRMTRSPAHGKERQLEVLFHLLRHGPAIFPT